MEITDDVLRAARMGPYQELAWVIRFELEPGVSKVKQQLLKDEIFTFSDEHHLGLAGELGGFVVVSTTNRKAVTTEEQHLLTTWLKKRSEVVRVHENEGDGYTDAWVEQLLHWGNWQTNTFAEFFS